MESHKKAIIINAAWRGWYARGSERLERSLIYHGWNYDMKFWRDEKINMLFEENCPYTIKAAALDEVIANGYTHILWMDCSLWCNQDPNILMEIIDKEGGLFIKSGYNLAQTAADTDLQFAGITRDDAEQLPELWSCIFGINLETEQGKKFVEYFYEAYYAGVFNTPRTHSGLSDDARFLHARQDQTATTIAFHKSGYEKLYEPGQIISNYTERENNKEAIIFMRGM